jgi:hypothetical protein
MLGKAAKAAGVAVDIEVHGDHTMTVRTRAPAESPKNPARRDNSESTRNEWDGEFQPVATAS